MGCACSKASRGPPPPHVLYCRLPEGVHSHMLEHVDMKKLTKLIKSGRLAPLYPHDVEKQDVMEECPICTVSYPSMNTASCCSARVCTECFVYHQTASDPPGEAQCPFCKYTPFSVRYLGSKSKEQLLQEKAEEQVWKQAKQRLKLQQDTPVAGGSTSTPPALDAAACIPRSPPSQQHTQQQQQQHTHLQEQQQQEPWRREEEDQHSWLDTLSSPDGARRVESISVFAGYHHRSSSSSGGTAAAADTGALQDTSSTSTATTAAGAGAEGAVSQTEELGLQQQYDHEQQQETLYRRSQLLELQLQQLSELRVLHEAGLLPGYAAAELSGLRLEELDEILVEQAIMESLQQQTAGSSDLQDGAAIQAAASLSSR